MKKKRNTVISNLWWGFKESVTFGRPLWIFAMLLLPLEILLPVTESFASEILVEIIPGANSINDVMTTVIGIGVILAAEAGLIEFLNYRSVAIDYRVNAAMMKRVFLFTGTLPYELTEERAFKTTEGYVNADMDEGGTIGLSFSNAVKAVLRDFAELLTCSGLIVNIDPYLLLICLLSAGLTLIPIRFRDEYYRRHRHMWAKDERKVRYIESLGKRFEEAKDIKMYHLQPLVIRLLDEHHKEVLKWEERCGWKRIWADLVMTVLSVIQSGSAYYFLVSRVMGGQITVGRFVFLLGIVSLISSSLQRFVEDIGDIADMSSQIGYYRELFSFGDMSKKGENLPENSDFAISAENVVYRYENAESNTIKGITISIHRGERLAIVGLNGAGKTTLVKLLCGLYKPTSGKIRYMPTGEEKTYGMFSVVFQDMHPLGLTIEEYITSSDPLAEDRVIRLQQSIETAGLSTVIDALPQGVRTHLVRGVYEDGIDLSGGEYQRLMLARAVYKNAPILILDEPTSALDPIAESEIYAWYEHLSQDKTSIFISHRFASTRFCDRILVLENGQIIEEGTHESLLRRKGRYAELFEAQSQYYREELHDE